MKFASFNKKNPNKLSGLTKKRRMKHKLSNLNLDEMLEIVDIVNLYNNEKQMPSVKNKRVGNYAEEIIRLNGSAVTAKKANNALVKINHRIVQENKKESNLREGKRLYNDLMKLN